MAIKMANRNSNDYANFPVIPPIFFHPIPWFGFPSRVANFASILQAPLSASWRWKEEAMLSMVDGAEQHSKRLEAPVCRG